MRINVLKKGDRVLTVTSELIAIERKNGEVDILPMSSDGMGLRIDVDKKVTIGYGANTVQVKSDKITITTF